MTDPRNSKPAQGSQIDVLVAGAGIGGLLISALLLQKGRSVHLSEKLAKAGGRWSPEKRAGFTLGAGFAFGDAAWWRAYADRLGLASPTLPVAEGKALQHSSRGWSHPETLPTWEHFLSEACSEYPAGGLHGITEALLDYCRRQPGFSVSFEGPVTTLTCEGGKVKSASLGAGHEVFPSEVYWCADYKDLLEVMAGEGIPAAGPERVSWLKRYVKSPAQPGVVLEFAHSTKLGDFTETLVLPFQAGEKEDRRFLIGSIVSNRDASLAPEGSSLSSWILPLTEAEWGDNHETMKKIRAARRLVEKAFPQLEKTLKFDRVLVLESTVSPLAKKKGEWQAPLENLRLAADWAMPQGATLPSLAGTLLGQA
ncbi:MAG TPA: NAD(P)-binding protein [Bdellovibrionota bacterium]|jgi:phytoene dehydrogenase-like protein